MKKEVRTAILDEDLSIELYKFEGIRQKFPNHFHEYYVIGLVEKGQRFLVYNNEKYEIEPGDIILFNPLTGHACCEIGEERFDYFCINVSRNTMKSTTLEITGKEYLPIFEKPVLRNSNLNLSLKELCAIISKEEKDFRKEEVYLFLMEQLIKEYSKCPDISDEVICDENVKNVCEYLEKNYSKNISLDELCNLVEMKKLSLLRSFAKQMGITPYSYLEVIRINKSKEFLEKGENIANVAFKTGFSDQSHFSNFFKKFTGLTPKLYVDIFKNEGGRETKIEQCPPILVNDNE